MARIDRYLPNLVYGANDGIITTFAVVAGVAGAQLSTRAVIILGISNLLADGFSMGASNFLSIRSARALEPPNDNRAAPTPFRQGTATFVAFIVAGALPLASYIVPMPGSRFALSVFFTLMTLLLVGGARSWVTHGGWWRNALEMLSVGAVAATVAFLVGRFLASLNLGT